MVAEMSQLILTQRDDQIRNYCRGKFSGHGNESIKSGNHSYIKCFTASLRWDTRAKQNHCYTAAVIIRKLFNKLKLGATEQPTMTEPPPPTMPPLPEETTVTPQPQVNVTEATVEPETEQPQPPTQPTLPPDVETIPPQTEPPPPPPTEPELETEPPPTEPPPTEPPPTQPSEPATDVDVDDKLDMGAGDMTPPVTDTEKLKAQLALKWLFSYQTEPPPTEPPPTQPPEQVTKFEPATEQPAPNGVSSTTVAVDDKIDMGAGDMRQPAIDAEKLNAQQALNFLFSYDTNIKEV